MIDRKPMLTLLPTLVAIGGTAFFASIAYRSRKHRHRTDVAVPLEASGSARAASRGVQWRILVSVGSGVIIAVAVALAPLPILHLGLGSAIAPGVGGIVACLVISAAPLPRSPQQSGVRRANLVPRLAWSFGPRWRFALPLVAVPIVFLIATASLSSTDGRGHWREIGQITPAGYEAAPYPGWFYATPLLVVTVLLSLTALLAICRIAAARSLGTPEMVDFDRAIRSALSRFVMLVSSALMVLYMGGIALLAGSASSTVSQWSKPSAQFEKRLGAVAADGSDPTFTFHGSAGDFIHGVVQPQYTAAAIETTLGIVLIGFGLTLAYLALTSGRIRWSAATPAEADKRESLPA